MKCEPLAPAFAKIERAKRHISDLSDAIESFLDSRPYKIASEINADRTEEVWRIVPDCIPTSIDTIVADALHNLRTPLDKMLTGFVDSRAPSTAKGQRHKYISFPVPDSREAFEGALKGLKKHLTNSEVIEFLRDTEAYKGGNGSLFYFLHDADVGEKHHPILTQVAVSSPFTWVRNIKGTGVILAVGSRNGQHLVRSPDGSGLIAPSDAQRPILRQDPQNGGFALEFSGPYDDMEYMTTVPGSQIKCDLKPAINIAFRDCLGFEGKPVVFALQQMTNLVERILLTFQRRFFV